MKVSLKSKSLTAVRVPCFIAAAAAGVTAQSDGSQQNKTGRAGTFAIVGARVVTVSGGVIERARSYTTERSRPCGGSSSAAGAEESTVPAPCPG